MDQTKVDIEQAIEAADKWMDHARPIIKCWLAMHDVGFFSDVICENHYGKDAISKMKTSDYREAADICYKASNELFAMIEAIRDNYRCDYSQSYTSDLTDAEGDAVEEFNDELERRMISVEAAVRIVEGEA